MSRDVTRCHQVSPGVTKCHGMSRSITKCLRGVTVSQNVSELSPNVTKVSPKCHGMSRNVTKCHNLSPKCHRYVTVCHHLSRSCHRLSLQITEHHVHCLCDIDLLGWGVAWYVLVIRRDRVRLKEFDVPLWIPNADHMPRMTAAFDVRSPDVPSRSFPTAHVYAMRLLALTQPPRLHTMRHLASRC